MDVQDDRGSVRGVLILNDVVVAGGSVEVPVRVAGVESLMGRSL